MARASFTEHAQGTFSVADELDCTARPPILSLARPHHFNQ